MTNDYDAFAATRQERLKKGESLPHRYIEKPAMKALLPDLHGKKILLLGCGTGEETALLEQFGASNMVGVDLSQVSIRLAAESYPAHTFKVADMHHLYFEDGAFDFVYSSLAVHYSSHPVDVYKEVWRVLAPGGTFQFSASHPMRWSSERVDIAGVPTKLLGYSEGDAPLRTYGSYLDFTEHSETLFHGETLSFWTGPPSMHFGLLRKTGFDVSDFVETKANTEVKESHPEYYGRFSLFPQFVVFVAKRPN